MPDIFLNDFKCKSSFILDRTDLIGDFLRLRENLDVLGKTNVRFVLSILNYIKISCLHYFGAAFGVKFSGSGVAKIVHDTHVYQVIATRMIAACDSCCKYYAR